MTFALISNGRVHQLFAENPNLGEGMDVRDVSKISGIAEHWTVAPDGTFAAPAAPEVSTVPPSVTSAQAKIQLRRAGLRDQVDEIISRANGEVQDWFTDARTWQRDNVNVAAVGESLNLTPAAIDDLFREAAKIDA